MNTQINTINTYNTISSPRQDQHSYFAISPRQDAQAYAKAHLNIVTSPRENIPILNSIVSNVSTNKAGTNYGNEMNYYK